MRLSLFPGDQAYKVLGSRPRFSPRIKTVKLSDPGHVVWILGALEACTEATTKLLDRKGAGRGRKERGGKERGRGREERKQVEGGRRGEEGRRERTHKVR